MTMTLEQWATQNDMSDAQLCVALGLASRMSAWRYRKHQRIPPPELMRKIWELTKGAVTANDFYGLAPVAAELGGEAVELGGEVLGAGAVGELVHEAAKAGHQGIGIGGGVAGQGLQLADLAVSGAVVAGAVVAHGGLSHSEEGRR